MNAGSFRRQTLRYLHAILFEAALAPANDRTSKAVFSRSQVAAEAMDGRLLGNPANLVVSEDRRTVYVVNHHGAIDNTQRQRREPTDGGPSPRCPAWPTSRTPWRLCGDNE